MVMVMVHETPQRSPGLNVGRAVVLESKSMSTSASASARARANRLPRARACEARAVACRDGARLGIRVGVSFATHAQGAIADEGRGADLGRDLALAAARAGSVAEATAAHDGAHVLAGAAAGRHAASRVLGLLLLALGSERRASRVGAARERGRGGHALLVLVHGARVRGAGADLASDSDLGLVVAAHRVHDEVAVAAVHGHRGARRRLAAARAGNNTAATAAHDARHLRVVRPGRNTRTPTAHSLHRSTVAAKDTVHNSCWYL
mmetsp:Transcript_68848/g.190568  ORF Transcript_68848/g.190568 Transcript_68848/m.190568 type:complete len:264 (-) Transcript_68848:15-806(-)